MRTAAMISLGWIVPGGAYLMTRRYLQFALFASAVTAAAIAGVALQGGWGMPGASELAGLDTMSSLLFRAGAIAKLLAGLPILAAAVIHDPGGFLSSRVHEYGNVLLILAGVMNVLGISSALEQREN